VDCAGAVVGTKGCGKLLNKKYFFYMKYFNNLIGGGNPILSFEYTAEYGIELWETYPYEGK